MEKSLPNDVEIAALLPAYTNEGDITRILLTNGTELVYRRTMRSTLAKLARRRCKDVTLLRRWASRYTHRALNNPIAASSDLVLVPVKTRRPRVEGWLMSMWSPFPARPFVNMTTLHARKLSVNGPR